MERGIGVGPKDGSRSSGGYKRNIGPRSLDCPRTLLARLAIDLPRGQVSRNSFPDLGVSAQLESFSEIWA